MSFKTGDIVHYIRKGEGKVTHVENSNCDYPVFVTWKKIPKGMAEREQFTLDGKVHKFDIYPSLSHVPYHKAVITERPIDYNDYVGKWGYFSEHEDFSKSIIGKLESFKNFADQPFTIKYSLDERSQYFRPLTDEQIEILNLK